MEGRVEGLIISIILVEDHESDAKLLIQVLTKTCVTSVGYLPCIFNVLLVGDLVDLLITNLYMVYAKNACLRLC